MNNDFVIETERLYLRQMEQTDIQALSRILQDDEVMYAYEGAFTDEEVQTWLNKQFTRYKIHGYGLWAVILKNSDEMIGQCGVTIQNWKEQQILEVGYLFAKQYWHKGYATEAARACKQYAFSVVKANEVYSIIRDTNKASINVAIRNGMEVVDQWTKHYRGVDMPHFLYRAKNV